MRLYAHEGGRLACAKHGGSYLMNATKRAKANQTTFETPLGTWYRMGGLDHDDLLGMGVLPVCEDCGCNAYPFVVQRNDGEIVHVWVGNESAHGDDPWGLEEVATVVFLPDGRSWLEANTNFLSTPLAEMMVTA